MDDKFLYQNRPAVRPDFQQKLYERLSSRAAQSKTANPNFRLVIRFALISLILFAALFTFSEPARAGIVELIRIIAGFEVEVSFWRPSIEDDNSFSFSSSPDENTISYALKDIPFEFALPAYVPDDYSFSEKLQILKDNGNQISVTYITPEGSSWINLRIDDRARTWPITISDLDSAEEIQINGQPALLVRGTFYSQDFGDWKHTSHFTKIYLQKDGLTYFLIVSPKFNQETGEAESALPLDELIRMAESIPALQNNEDDSNLYKQQAVDNILKNPPFLLKAPAYLPDGFVAREGNVANSNTWVRLVWQNQTDQNIRLMIQEDWRILRPSGIETAKRENINGRYTWVIQGGFGEDGQWDSTKKDTELYWRIGGLVYRLSSDTVDELELIRIAKSIK
ncbi:MAG: DUF4367 domain-containing protein [Anaerolineae bacterium]|nr:DUF4367 domain-containing protein [Anaerolineae bacterium]